MINAAVCPPPAYVLAIVFLLSAISFCCCNMLTSHWHRDMTWFTEGSCWWHTLLCSECSQVFLIILFKHFKWYVSSSLPLHKIPIPHPSSTSPLPLWASSTHSLTNPKKFNNFRIHLGPIWIKVSENCSLSTTRSLSHSPLLDSAPNTYTWVQCVCLCFPL